MSEVVVDVVGDELKASVACGMLQSDGVRCYFRPATQFGLHGVIGSAAAGGWLAQEIVVDADDVERAKTLLAEHRD